MPVSYRLNGIDLLMVYAYYLGFCSIMVANGAGAELVPTLGIFQTRGDVGGISQYSIGTAGSDASG